MSTNTKRALWVTWLVLMSWILFQVYGWLGALGMTGAGLIGAVATIFINRKVKRDQQIRFRDPGGEF